MNGNGTFVRFGASVLHNIGSIFRFTFVRLWTKISWNQNCNKKENDSYFSCSLVCVQIEWTILIICMMLIKKPSTTIPSLSNFQWQFQIWAFFDFTKKNRFRKKSFCSKTIESLVNYVLPIPPPVAVIS